jgi:Acyl-CoA reductase (LuxC)
MSPDTLSSALASDGQGIVRMPSLVKGQLRYPSHVSRAVLERRLAEVPAVLGSDQLHSFRLDDAYVIPQAVSDNRTPDQIRFLVLPYAEASSMVESDPSEIARDLVALPVAEILDYVGAIRDVLRQAPQWLADAASLSSAASVLDSQSLNLSFQMLPLLLDPDAVGEAIDRELGMHEMSGRQFLDGWVPVPAQIHPGINARIRDAIFGSAAAQDQHGALCVRAVPTRQLHVTAGNSPLLPFLSWLRSAATKGAAVIKCPVEATATTAVLALAMHAVDPRHPLARHTSLAYWKGGDRAVEDVLLAANAFDRLVVWGSGTTVEDLVRRAPHLKSVVFRPRYGVSLIGREALGADLQRTAMAAASDSTIANQHACLASLVHYVEASEDVAVRYCEALASALAVWDEKLPGSQSPSAIGRLRRLQRGTALEDRWWQNRGNDGPRSAVVLVRDPFDVAAHPMCRLVVVRRVDSLADALAYLTASVSTVGVAPESRRLDLRDAIAAAGVSNIMPLGECERAYAGIPHDGMRVMSELVNWTTG